MRNYMRILAATFAASLFTSGLAQPSSAAPKPKVVVNKPSAPTITAITSTTPKKNKVNLTISISLPASNGGSVITGSKVAAKGATCSMAKLKTTCIVKNVKVGSSLNFSAQSKNKKGFGPASGAVSYAVNGGSWSPPAPAAEDPVIAAPPYVPPSVPAPLAPTCTITGTTGNDTIYGTSSGDIICGMGGQDIIHGLAGNDKIYAVTIGSNLNSSPSPKGTGYPTGSTIYGDDGDDQIFGSSKNDVLIGNSGSDSYQLNGGSDLCQFDKYDNFVDNCRSNRSILPDQQIEALAIYYPNTSIYEIDIRNTGNSWTFLCEMNWYVTFDNWAEGGGGCPGWIGPGQVIHYAGDGYMPDSVSNRDGIPGFPYIYAYDIEPFSKVREMNRGILVNFEEPTWDNDNYQWVVPFTASNETGSSGTLNLEIQAMNSIGEVISQGTAYTAVGYPYVKPTISAHGTVSGYIGFERSTTLIMRKDFQIVNLRIE